MYLKKYYKKKDKGYLKIYKLTKINNQLKSFSNFFLSWIDYTKGPILFHFSWVFKINFYPKIWKDSRFTSYITVKSKKRYTGFIIKLNAI